jgi:hypothetical protein
MGGYNSGRYGWRGVVEHRKRIDMRAFAKTGVMERGGSGSLNWSSGGEEIGSLGFRIESGGRVELDYVLTDEAGEKTSIHYSLATTSIPCRYGGRRYYWLCPWCGRRREVLLMARQGREWACRRCLKLRYVSQGLSPAYRLQRRADTIYARLGADDSEFVTKPRGMHWSTFNRRMDLAADLASQADFHFLMRLRRFGFAGWDDALEDATN